MNYFIWLVCLKHGGRQFSMFTMTAAGTTIFLGFGVESDVVKPVLLCL